MARSLGEPPTQPSQAPRPSGDDRLDSWKEIAAFLQRDVRTVQRWEKHAGLPVHRHTSRLRTAYAYRSEIDAWWRAHEQTITGAGDAGARTGWPGWIGRASLLAAAAVVTVAAAVAIGRTIVARPPAEAPPPAPLQPQAVLMARFDDGAGDPGFAAELEETVARQLGRGGLEAAAPARVTRTLRLMRKDATAPVTRAVGSEVCVRDGRIKFLLSGRIHKIQSRYFVDVQAIDPADGRIAGSLERQAEDRRVLLSEIEREIPRFAATLAAAGRTATAAAEPLEQVTTASLPALRLYTAAVVAGGRRQWAASEMLARRAVAADDQFASAHAWVAWAMRQQGRTARECLPILERAVALSSATTDRESYFIAGTHHTVAGNLLSAVAAYEALLRLQPRDRQVIDRLIEAYSRLGRVRDAVELSVARADADPADFYSNVRAAHALLTWQGDKERASTFVRRAEPLASRAALADRPAWGAWLTALPAFHAWATGDSRTALDRLAPLERRLDLSLGRERDALATTVGFSYLALGRRQHAERAFRQAGSPTRQINLALQALALDDKRAARDWLLQIRQHSALRPALFARVGLIAEAETGLERAAPSEHREGNAEVARGLIAARKRHDEAAVASLRRGIELLRFSGEPEYFLAIDALARHWKARGETDRALPLLVDATSQRSRTYGAPHWTGAFWIKASADLAATYRRLGRHEEAARLGAIVRQVLTDADPGHPAARLIGSGGR